MDSEIELLKHQLPTIPSVVGSMTKHTTDELKSPCPWCGGNDRFIYTISEDRAMCRQCWGKGGDRIAFHAKMAGMKNNDFIKKKTVELRSQGLLSQVSQVQPINGEGQQARQGKKNVNEVDLEKEWRDRNLPVKANTLFPLFNVRRAISEKTIIDSFKSGSLHYRTHRGKPSACSRFEKLDGTISAIQYLTIDESNYDHADDKRAFHKGSRPKEGFFFAGQSFESSAKVCLVESVINALSGADVFPDFCWAAVGSANMTSKVEALKGKDKEFILCFDNDDAGKKACNNAACVLGVGEKVQTISWPGGAGDGLDLNDLLKAGQRDVIPDLIANAKPIMVMEFAHDYSKSGLIPCLPDEPMPLVRVIAPGLPFPVDVLPEIMKNAIYSLARGVQAPLGLCAQSALAAVCLATQGHADIIIDGRLFPISENFITIAESGERKSSVDKFVLRPVREHQKALKKVYESKMIDYKIKHASWAKAKDKALSSGKNYEDMQTRLRELGPEPTHPVGYIVSFEEATPQGIMKNFLNGYPSAGLFSDEGGRVLGGHGMKAENRMLTLASLNGFWDGKAHVHKLTSGDGVTSVQGKRLSTHIMVQPGVALSLMNDEMSDDIGFLARCLIVQPETTIGTRQYHAFDLSTDMSMNLFWGSILNTMDAPLCLAEGTANELNPRTITLDHEAKVLWIAFHNRIESEMAKNGSMEHVRAFGSKLAEHAARLAGALQLFGNVHSNSISARSMTAGVALADYYLSENIRITEQAKDDPELIQAELLKDWLLEKWAPKYGELFNTPSMCRYAPSGMRSAKIVKSAIQTLTEYGWVKPSTGDFMTNDKTQKAQWRIIGHQ